jgi:queuine tRNA-ribosyltransferase
MGPEESMQVQRDLGSDIVMIFDECTPYPASEEAVQKSMERSLRWAQRSRLAHGDNPSALFGIVQGGMYEQLREASLEGLKSLDFDGYAIGGLSVGEDRQTRLRVITETIDLLPEDKPVYLMGMGTPEDLVEAVILGVDMFDCVMPTRNARNGTLFTTRGRLSIKNACYIEDERPIDEDCQCYSCTHFSRAYLRHLFMAKELLAYRVNTIHNLHYYAHLMAGIRRAICEDRLADYCKRFYELQRGEGTQGLRK